MHHVPPFEQVLGLGIIGTLASIIDMNESLKFLILLLTFVGLVIKLWEQVKKSEYFLEDIKKLWAKFKKWKKHLKQLNQILLENEETERPKKAIQSLSKSQRNIVVKEDKSKIIRLGIWAVFLIVVGGIAASLLPEHSVGSFFDLLKTIVTSLLI